MQATRDGAGATCDELVEQHRRWNFAVNAGDLISVNLAKSFIFSSTILTLYASYLTSSAVLIGLIPAIQQVGYLLPQLLTARKSETLSRFKPYVVRISVMERMPYLFIALAIFLWPRAPSWFAYTMLAVNIGIATGCAGLATPAWKAMLGKVIHPDRRGLLFSLGVGAGGFLGVGGAWLARWILETRSFPVSYGLCFLLSFVGQALSFFFLTLNREPEKKVAAAVPPLVEYLRELPEILKRDRNFSMYLASQTLFILGTMAASFYIIYGRYHFGSNDAFAAGLTMVALVTQSAGTPVLGWLSDRLGHKWTAELSSWLGIAALVLMLFIPSAVVALPRVHPGEPLGGGDGDLAELHHDGVREDREAADVHGPLGHAARLSHAARARDRWLGARRGRLRAAVRRRPRDSARGLGPAAVGRVGPADRAHRGPPRGLS